MTLLSRKPTLGAVPTAITQALQLQQQQGGAPRVVVRAPRQSGVELDVRELERTNIALMVGESR